MNSEISHLHISKVSQRLAETLRDLYNDARDNDGRIPHNSEAHATIGETMIGGAAFFITVDGLHYMIPIIPLAEQDQTGPLTYEPKPEGYV